MIYVVENPCQIALDARSNKDYVRDYVTAMWFYLYLCNTNMELCTYMVIRMRQNLLTVK